MGILIKYQYSTNYSLKWNCSRHKNRQVLYKQHLSDLFFPLNVRGHNICIQKRKDVYRVMTWQWLFLDNIITCDFLSRLLKVPIVNMFFLWSKIKKGHRIWNQRDLCLNPHNVTFQLCQPGQVRLPSLHLLIHKIATTCSREWFWLLNRWGVHKRLSTTPCT